MNIVFWVLVGIICNMVLGAAVWVAIDDKEQRFYKRYERCPPQVSWFLQPMILTAWPVGLWLWWRRK